MSKRSRMQRKQEAMRRRAEQQTALQNKSEDISVGQLVLQRMDKLIDAQNQANVNGNQQATAIKLVDVENRNGMPEATPNKTETATVTPQKVADWPDNWPVCPKTYNAVEWRRALENKEYYELKMIENEGKKPWFQYPKYGYQYSEPVYCTPEMMRSFLAHMPINRRHKENSSDSHSRDFQNERWIQSHESIAIDTNGNAIDGQHRGNGIIKAGTGWPLYVTWNVPFESIYTVDSGDKRKINEKLGLLFPDSNLTNKAAALCRAMMWGLANRGVRYSESEIAEFSVKQHGILTWLSANMRGYRADSQAAIAKAMLWWGENLVAPFVWRLRKLAFDGPDDPAKALYLWLIKAKQEGRKSAYANPTVYYKKTLSAVCTAAEGRSAKKIFQKNEDIFEWTSGWEVPDNSPCGGKVFTGWWDNKVLTTAEAELNLDDQLED